MVLYIIQILIIFSIDHLILLWNKTKQNILHVMPCFHWLDQEIGLKEKVYF